MIISRLNGGLGNQMFQYALGRVMTKLNKTEFFLDLSLYDSNIKIDTPRSYELDIFPNITALKISSEKLATFTKPNKWKLLLNHYLKLHLQAYPKNWIRENDHNYHPEILKLRGNYLLDGYWQTEKYFKRYRKLILKDFSFPEKISKKNKDILELIKRKNAVSIHVRRRDYVANKYTSAYHSTCSFSYYTKATSYIQKKVKNPWFIIFSDDPRWCKKHLPVPKDTFFVSHNTGKNSFEDMRLMSYCKHNIVANSSFSWWGAWLNQNQEKIVIAPRKWFNDPKVNPHDIIPDSWIKI